MKDIIDVTAEDMQEKSLNSNIEEVRLALISIDKRLKSASIRELESHSIFVPLSDFYDRDNVCRGKIIIKEITPFLTSKNYSVDIEEFRADNITYLKGISISW